MQRWGDSKSSHSQVPWTVFSRSPVRLVNFSDLTSFIKPSTEHTEKLVMNMEMLGQVHPQHPYPGTKKILVHEARTKANFLWEGYTWWLYFLISLIFKFCLFSNNPLCVSKMALTLAKSHLSFSVPTRSCRGSVIRGEADPHTCWVTTLSGTTSHLVWTEVYCTVGITILCS